MKTTLLLIMLAVMSTCMAQQPALKYITTKPMPYHDALALNGAKDPTSNLITINNTTAPILEKYFGTTEPAAIKAEIIKNRFLKGLFTTGSGEAGLDAIGLLPSSIGGMDVTNFAEGVARFLAERTREELSVAFFDKMKEQFNYFPELRTLFPSTYQLLMHIESYSYANVIQALKESFETDVKNLQTSLYDISNLDSTACTGPSSTKCEKAEKDACITRMNAIHVFFKTEQGKWVRFGLGISRNIKSGVNVGQLLNDASTSPELGEIVDSSSKNSNYISYDVANGVKLANLFSQSLLDTSANQVWVSPQQLSKLFEGGTNMPAFRIYLGLLYEQIKNQKVAFMKKDHSVDTLFRVIDTAAADINKFMVNLRPVVQEMSQKFATANSAYKKIAQANIKGEPFNADALYDHYKTVTGLLKQILNINLISDRVPEIRTKGLEIINILDPAVDLVYHTYDKSYTAAVWDATNLFFNVNTAVNDGLFGANKTLLFESKTTKAVIKYGTFISTVATAKNSDEVKKALQSATLPVGSASIKKKTNWSIGINAYVGGYFGSAGLKSVDTTSKSIRIDSNFVTNRLDTTISYKTKKNYTKTYGLFAPIGIAFNVGLKRANYSAKNASSLTAFIQLIDVGALVNFYLVKGDTATMPSNVKIRLINIFAPGAQLAYGFPRIPVSIMGGVQFIPAINELNDLAGTAQTQTTFGWRGHISIVVDIPMFNIKVWDYKK